MRRWRAGLVVAAAIVLAPLDGAAQTAPAAKQSYTVAGHNRAIRQEDFAGLGKPTVLHMQDQLQAIYQNLPEWKRDYALKEQPLRDGLVGPITLSWLQRYAFNFKLMTEADFVGDLPANLDRIAAFGAAHSDDLRILLSREFEDWDAAQAADVKGRDYVVRRQGNTQELQALVNRFRASRKTPPSGNLADVDGGGYFNYVLKPGDLDLLAGKDQEMKVLAKLKDQKFNSLDEMRVALTAVFGPRDGLLKSLWPVVRNNTPEFDGFLIDKAKLAELKKNGTLNADLQDDLGALGTVYLKSRKDYDTFIDGHAAAGTLAINAQETETLAEATRVFDNYHLDDQALETIKHALKGKVQNAGVPSVVAKLLQKIEDVDYAELGLFSSAAKSKIGMGLGMCRYNSPRNNPYVSSLRISDDDLNALQKSLEALNNSPRVDLDAVFARIGELRETKILCGELEMKDARTTVETIYSTYLAPAIEGAARKRIDGTIAQIDISGSDKCGCALDDLSGVVYGFYPYWEEKNEEMKEKKKSVQPVNFRMLNRVAYYGLTVGDVGDFRLGAENFKIRDGSRKANEFVRVAHQYNSKVDWMIRKNDWKGEWSHLSPANKQAFFAQMEANIVALLGTELEDAESKLRYYTSFGLAGRNTRGDGVTLYFAEYPNDVDSKVLFNNFYLSLRQKMDQMHMWLNILVSQDTLVNDKATGGAFSLGNLASLRKKRTATEPNIREAQRNNDEYILVLMNEPSSDSKRALRSEIENDFALHGADRADFLRSVLPVWHFDDRNFQQLEDDVVYSRDNFGGVGFWAPNFKNLAEEVKDPDQSCLQSEQIVVCLLKNYHDEGAGSSLSGPVESFVCMHSWAFQIALTVLIMLIVTQIILYFQVCKAQDFIKTNLLVLLGLFVLPALAIFTLLLGYDPVYAKLARGQLPFIAASTALLLVLVGVGVYLRKRREFPQREKQSKR